MKKVLWLLVCLMTMVVSFTSCETKSSFSNAAKEKAEAYRDSIARMGFVADSIAVAKHNAETAAKYSNLFKVKKDEFSDNDWVEPKNAPKYRNQNGVYCYFATKNGKTATNFRFVYQYYSDDWLFIRNMIFNIDGENITIIPDMETDCGYGGKIWEWCDEAVNYNTSGITEEFIKKVANATSVKIKMNGTQYYDTRVLSTAQIKSIKNTYEYYLALGGSFTN